METKATGIELKALTPTHFEQDNADCSLRFIPAVPGTQRMVSAVSRLPFLLILALLNFMTWCDTLNYVCVPQQFSESYHKIESLNLVTLPYKKTPWFESASEIYRPSDRRLSAK
jgi:hypothetical protein